MGNFVKALVRSPASITFLLLILTLILGVVTTPDFRSASYLLDKSSLYMHVGFMALAMTFVITAGQIDLSVGSGAVLTFVISAMAYEAGLPMPCVIPLALLTGTTLGLLNGLLVGYLNLPALVVTLGTLALYRGIAQVLIGERTIGKFPSWFTGVDYVKVGPADFAVPLPLILFLAAAVVAGFLLSKSTLGRKVVALGTNEPATRYAGLSVPRIKLTVFAMSGLCMGIAALLRMSSLRVVDHKQFKGDELLAITAVVLGGTVISGGRGSVPGTVLALLLLVVVRSALGVNNVRAENQLAITGTLLVGAVLLTSLMLRLSTRRRPSSVSSLPPSPPPPPSSPAPSAA